MTGRAAQKAEAIKRVVLDVAGVMTDGTLTYGGAAESEWKSFHVKDGLGIKLLQRQGIKVAIITGRLSEAVERRAQELEIKMLVQGRDDKGAALRELLDSMALDYSTVAYMGDDLPDLAALRLAGLATCPCDATEAVLKLADWVAPVAGGRGAVRALCDFILTAQGHLPANCETFQ